MGASPGGFNFRGKIDEVNLFNHALTPQEMLAIYNAQSGGMCKDQVNHPPVVNAGPDQTITVRDTANLQGTATDDGRPAGSTLATIWSVVSGPGTVTFENPQQAITTATFSLSGTYVLRLTANDSDLTSDDDVVVTVNPTAGNQPPAVSAGANQTILIEQSATLNGTATDDGLPEGNTLEITWSVVSGPGQVSFANAHQAQTTATFSIPGTYVLRLTAFDSELTRFADVTITVKPTNHAPVVNAGPDLVITLPGTALLNGTATDDGLPSGSTLSVLWSVVSGPGQAGFNPVNRAASIASFNTPGSYVLRLTANDSELTTSDDVNVEVRPTAPLPTVTINSPADGSTITNRTSFFGSVSEGSVWKLEYSLNTDDGSPAQVWTTIASGSTAVTNSLLGTFDPTLLVNGIYTVRLRATNAGGQVSENTVSAVVDGELKVGNFTLSFRDLSVPVAGLPIEVIRTYDSREKRVGDFGVGWTLGIKNVRVEKSGVLGLNWEQTVTQGFLPTFCLQATKVPLVTVTFPDGKLYKFQASLNAQCQLIAPFEFATVRFNQLTGSPGTQGAKLVALDGTDVFVVGAAPGDVELIDADTVDLYNPTRFQLTTAEGYVYVIDQKAGLQSMVDPNGNTLNVSASGIIHSSGKSISFVRDANGRITRITDPAGDALVYAYDTNGDLVSFTDQENNVTAYTYNSTHGLLGIRDPRGIQPIRNEYDDQGRLIKHTDANGKTVTYTHDINGRRETNVDRLGNTTIYDYNTSGQIVRITNAQGSTTTYTFDSRGNRLSETNAAGKVTTYTYDAQNNLISQTDPSGNTTSQTYNLFRQVLTQTDALGRVTTNTYDTKGNLTSVKDRAGHTTTYTYDSKGLRTSLTDAQNNVTRYEYDTAGNLTKETDALNRVTTFTYDVNGNVKTKTESRTLASGAVETLLTSYVYDKLNRLTKTTYPDGITTESVYNSIGRETEVKDSQGRRTTYEYDDMGRLTKTTFPDGTTEETTYDAEGHRLRTVDRSANATNFTYDILGRLVKTTYADSSFVSTKFDSLDRMIEQTDERGNTTRYEYDPNCGCSGRRSKITDALGNFRTFTYDANDNQITMTDAKGLITRFEYDALDRPTRVIHPDGTSRVTTYDSLGRIGSRTDEANRTTQFAYDKLSFLLSVTDANAGVTRYTYDEKGNRLSETDANNHTTLYQYDSIGRRTKRTLPLGMSETYGYDAAGKLITRTDFNGKVTTFTYDDAGRLTASTPDPGLGQPAVTFTYTPGGNRSTMTDAHGTTTYMYDVRDRLKTKAGPNGTLTYTYDTAGNVLSVRSANVNGVAVDYTYDALNRLATVVDQRLNGSTSYTYDPNGNLESILYPNGVSTSYTYNNLNRLTNMSAAKGSTIASFDYTLGPAGNRLAVTENGGRTVNYTYDALYRLTQETISGDAAPANNGTVSYTYDAVGNRLTRNSNVALLPSTTSTYDANDRVTTDTWDANGNTKAFNGINYDYDFENRLVSTSAGVTLVYDGDGNRVSKTVNGVTTKYLVDTNNPTGRAQVLEEIVGGSVQRQYTYGHELLSQRQLINGVWTTHFYGRDGQGSVRFLTDVSGNVSDTYTYDAFGNLLSRTGSTPNDYLYTGEQFDANIGFYYLRARYLNPSTGRFHTLDTFQGNIFEPQSLHKYLYAHADPVNKRDPSGNMAMATMAATTSTMNALNAIGALILATLLLDIHRKLYEAGVISTIQVPSLENILTSTRTGEKAIARARDQAREKTETAKRRFGCGGNILFHYTRIERAFLILAEQEMKVTPEWTDPNGIILQPGAYATAITPWHPMTQRELAAIFYFNPARAARADVSYFVALCNDTRPPFIPSPAGGQWVKPAPGGRTRVNAILAARNPMP